MKYRLPTKRTYCLVTACVYNEDNHCDDPAINKGNSDAECHKLTNKQVLEVLGLIFNIST